jgi:hypothetical protein
MLRLVKCDFPLDEVMIPTGRAGKQGVRDDKIQVPVKRYGTDRGRRPDAQGNGPLRVQDAVAGQRPTHAAVPEFGFDGDAAKTPPPSMRPFTGATADRALRDGCAMRKNTDMKRVNTLVIVVDAIAGQKALSQEPVPKRPCVSGPHFVKL